MFGKGNFPPSFGQPGWYAKLRHEDMLLKFRNMWEGLNYEYQFDTWNKINYLWAVIKKDTLIEL